MATKVLDAPLGAYTPHPVRERIESAEYKATLVAVAAARRAYEHAQQGPRHPQSGHTAFDAFKCAVKRVEAFRLGTASLLGQDVQEADIVLPETVSLVGEAEVGSEQWLRMRQSFLGGSDVGPICKVGQYGRRDYEQVRARKVDPAPRDQVHAGFPLIGDLWEPMLVQIAQDVLGVEVFTNKGTFSDGLRHVNLDAFTLDAEGRIEAVVECKTGSVEADWEDDAPAGYVLQVQHYMDVMGAKTGYIVANLNDSRLVVYRVDQADTVAAGPDSVKMIGDRFRYTDVKDYALALVEKWNQDRQEAPTGRHWSRHRTTPTDTLATSWGEALRRGMVFVDIETTTLSERTGHVLEIALVADDGAALHLMCGVPDDHAEWNGTGAVQVHGITLADVTGMPVLLHSPEMRAQITQFIGDRVVVAHHARFEQAWLAEAGMDFDYADTRDAFSAWVDADQRDNTMESLCRWAGVAYEGAHRAMPDTLMLRSACGRLTPVIRDVLSAAPVAA